jgi:putative tryptophan/tyrosine transport system substrate-binding protein
MRRRDFVTLIGGAATWPLAARAQQPGERIRRIGVLQDTAEDDPVRKKQFARFRDGLAGFGWLEGRTVLIERRFAAADARRYQQLAKELVALQPEVILAVSTPVTAALQRETNVIPIVFLGVSDPIGSGFAASLARPGSNLTGLMMYDVGIAGKWLAMLKEIAPRLARVALVAGPKTTAYDYFVQKNGRLRARLRRRLANRVDDWKLRERLLQMAREWKAATVDEGNRSSAVT